MKSLSYDVMSFSDITHEKGLKNLLIAILPTSYFWILATFFFLIYSFNMIDFVKNEIIFQTGLLHKTPVGDLIIMTVIAAPTGLAIGFTGRFIDRNPQLTLKLLLTSVPLSSIALLMDIFALAIRSELLVLISIFILGLFLGIEVTASNVLFCALIKSKHRGKGYAIGNLIFAILTLIILIISEVTELKFFFAFTAISLMGILLSIFLFSSIRHYKFWTNDLWPTKDFQLLKRPSVQAYFMSHMTIYFMLGLTIGSLAISGFTDFLGIRMGSNSVFWSIVILGTTISILPAGALADRWGRKNLVILSTYIIVIISLLLGSLELNWTTFTLSSLSIGIAFALLHPTLDSSLWIDLASKDSIGRYCGMNSLSLGAGLAFGFLTSYFFISGILPLTYDIIVFLYIGLAVLTLLPLFWTCDSYPPLEFFLLLVINEAGIPIFHYSFGGKKGLKVDLPLISGALSAVNSFMLEATGEKNASLNMVRHGSHFILTEVSKGEHKLTAAIFANKNDPELQKFLKDFLIRFHNRFYVEIESWQGNLSVFKEAQIDAEEVFGPLVTISDEDHLIEAGTLTK
ncbi:MAG: hypothetical protein ACTSPG_03060 [Candidatus Hodarchaeales archaeon]